MLFRPGVTYIVVIIVMITFIQVIVMDGTEHCNSNIRQCNSN